MAQKEKVAIIGVGRMGRGGRGRGPVGGAKKHKKKKKASEPMASVSDVLGFVWSLGTRVRALFVVGCIAGVGNGMVYPILAYLFASSFSKIAGAQTNGLEQVRNLAYTFMIVGIYAFSMACIQTGCLEICAHRATKSFRLQWFQSLLRQDAAFFDVHDIGGRFLLWIAIRLFHGIPASFAVFTETC